MAPLGRQNVCQFVVEQASGLALRPVGKATRLECRRVGGAAQRVELRPAEVCCDPVDRFRDVERVGAELRNVAGNGAEHVAATDLSEEPPERGR